MNDGVEVLADLLNTCIKLVLLEDDEEQELPIRDHLIEILSNFSNEDCLSIEGDSSLQGCDMRTYIDSELSSRFTLSATDLNFNMNNLGAWSDLLLNVRATIEYALSLQLIICLVHVSLLNKTSLSELAYLKEKYYQTLLELNSAENIHNKSQLNLILEKATEFYTQVLTVCCEPRDILGLYVNFQSDVAFQTLNSLAAHLSDPMSQDYFQFENCYKIFTASEDQAPHYTFQFFIEFNTVTSNRIMTIGRNIYLEVKEGQFCIANDEFIIALFTEFEFDSGVLYSISVVLRGDDISLYVDGNCVGSISLFEGSVKNIHQFDLGSMICSFKLFRFLIFNDALLDESIKVIYAMGSMMRDSYEKQLDLHGARQTLGETFLDKIGSSGMSLEEHLEKNVSANHDKILADCNPSDANSPSKHEGDETLFSESQNDDMEDLVNHLTMGKCYLYKGADLLSMFTSVNCFRILLCSLEYTKDMDELYDRLSHLMILLRNTHLRCWFRQEFGFPLLSHILCTKAIKRMNKSLPIQFLNLFQEYCGWDFSNITKSLIEDEAAYQTLVLNLDLWYLYSSGTTESDASVEIIRFLFFQISNLLENSKYQAYNSQKLRKLNVLENLCNTQHQLAETCGYPNMLDKVGAELSNVYFCLLKDSLTKANVQWLMQFGYCELKKGFHQNSKITLQAVDALLTDALNDNDAAAVKIFSDAVSPKFLVMLLDEVTLNGGAPTTVLNILFKILMVNKYLYRNFIKNGGTNLIRNILRNADGSYYEDIIYSLYLFSFGNYSFDKNTWISEEFQDEEVESGVDIVMKELLILAVELLEWAVMNDIRNSFPLDLESFICMFIKKLSCLSKSEENSFAFNSSISPLFQALHDLLLTLVKPQNASIYEKPAALLTELLCEIVTRNATVLNYWEFERYLLEITTCNPSFTISSSSNLDNKFNYIEKSFMKRIVPNVFKSLNARVDFNQIFLKNSNMIPNFVMILDRHKDALFLVGLEPEHHLQVFECLLKFLRLMENGHTLKGITKNALMDVFAISTANLLYALYRNNFKEIDCICYFCSICHNNCTSLFDLDHGAYQMNAVHLLLNFLILQLGESERPDVIMGCLKCIIVQRQRSIKGLSDIIGISDENLVQSSLLPIVKQENISELIDFLAHRDSLLLQKEHFVTLVEDILKIKKGQQSFDGKIANKKILENKQLRFEAEYSELDRKHTLFRSDNTYLDKRLVTLYSKYYTNFLTDLEEDSIVHNNEYNILKSHFNHALDLQLDRPTQCAWGIDSVQDNDMRKGRLIPFWEPLTEPNTASNQPQENETEELASKPQDRKMSSSMLSYDLISDLESIDLMSNEKKDRNRNVLKVLKENDSIRSIWNASLVIGLDSREGILIFGQHHLYFVGNYYFLKDENKVLNLAETSASERDTNINLITGNTYSPANIQKSHEVHSWDLVDLIFVTKRPFLLRDAAMELLMENGTNCFFSFKSKLHRDEVYHTLDKLPKNENIDPVLNSILQELNVRSSSVGSVNGISKVSLKTKLVKAFSNGPSLLDGLAATSLWQRGEISNFYYLIVLNILAGRTFNDLTQYPVFPWVIADYTSDVLDLNDPRTFRDFSKPMGGQSRKREQQFVERYEALEALGDSSSPPFHYGTHYSSAMIVSSYLIRLKPFVDSFLLLQDGKFGHADRLFSSIERTWLSAAVENTTDVRELTPEFFFLPEFLVNLNCYNFGENQNGEPVVDVDLPPWAMGDPKIFVWKNREALESPYVSSHLHLWVDLIFGFKQRGENAVSAVNVFNCLSYPGAVNLDTISDENERRAITGIIHNFGQTPLQIFQQPHPSRQSFNVKCIHSGIWSDMSSKPGLVCPWQTTTPVDNLKNERHIAKYINWGRHRDGKLFWMCYSFLDIFVCLDSEFVQIKLYAGRGLKIDSRKYEFLHFAQITAFSCWKRQQFITGDEYGLIKCWEFYKSGKSSFLRPMGSLYGHLSQISSLKTCREYSLLLSIDVSGVVYLWDMINYQLIRKLPLSAKEAAISAHNGTIALATSDNRLCLYNSSGMLYTDDDLKAESAISCLEFLNFSDFALGLKRHTYWKEKEVLIVGFANGHLRVYELILIEKSGWELKFLKLLESTNTVAITCIKTQLRIYNLDSGEQTTTEVPKVEILAGDEQRDLYFWR